MSDQPENRNNLEMHADRVSMPDGRYLIYYTFVAAADNDKNERGSDEGVEETDVRRET